MMPAPWRKLWVKMVECDDLAALLPPEPAPEMLWVRIIATADPYGRVPGDPYLLRARTFPKSDYTTGQIMRCAEALGAMLTWYEVGGKRYIQVTNFETYNPPDWSKIGRPEFPHPEQWQPPQSLLDFLAAHVHLEPFTRARYGLTDLTLSDTQRLHSETTLSDTQPLREVRSENLDNGKGNDLLQADGACAPPEPPAPAKKRGTAYVAEDLTPAIEAAKTALPASCRELAEAYLAAAAAENKGHVIGNGRALTLLNALVAAQIAVGDDVLFAYGLEQAVSHNAPNANYVKKAALSARQEGGNGKQGAPPIGPRKGSRVLAVTGKHEEEGKVQTWDEIAPRSKIT